MRRAVPSADLLELLRTDRGLDASEVEARRLQFGRNDVIVASGVGWRALAYETAKDPMLWFLLATSVLFAAVGDHVEAAVMLAATVPLAGMDALLHWRTQASTTSLSSRLAERAVVIRAGGEQTIPAAEVVPGDLALVAAGDWMPADGIVVGGELLQADESALTGESFPVPKRPLTERSAAAPYRPIDDARWAFAGTRLLVGKATVRVMSTGAATLYGEIVRSAARGRHEPTQLQRAIAGLVTTLLAAAAVLCIVLAWVRWRQNHDIVDALVSAVTLAVAAIPEEFPLVFTVFLGAGILRLARRRALVRRAVVVENIGRVTCICTDKTGTLTEGSVRVAHRIPTADVGADKLAEIAALASRPDSGDPLDAAIAAAGMQPPHGTKRLATHPYTEERRRETGVFRTLSGAVLIATKGAPETILPLCELGPAARADWESRAAELAASAHKVIACAWQEPGGGGSDAEPAHGYRLAGLLGCEDPLRPGVADAVAEAQRAGVRVIMVTGDHPSTAAALAREAGIGGDAPRVVSGPELEAALARAPAVRDTFDVVARALPAQKLALVRALQAQGDIVAVTGDGINDVPALQAADVGIAMGERGTRAAREASAIVLLDDNLRTIVNAIAEGRRLFLNLRLSFAYLLMIHLPLVLAAVAVPLGGYPLLYLPVHVVWLELIIHPTAMLVFQDLPDRHALTPRGPSAQRFFSAWEWSVIGGVGGAIAIAIVSGYEYTLGETGSAAHARAMAMVALVAASAMVTAALTALRTAAALALAAAALASAVVLVQVPTLASVLELEPLHADDWLLAVTGGFAPAAFAALLLRRGRVLRRAEPARRA
jgi:Ca2+-transporting ATPase